MKIVILSEQPSGSICGLRQFCEKLKQEENREVVCLQYAFGENRDILGEIKALHPDLLITVDLPGFEQCTLTDNLSYNLLDCKQLHLLLHENLRNETYLAGQLSIAMFFYCVGDLYRDELEKKYPGLPWLKSLPQWQDAAERQSAAKEQNAPDAQDAAAIFYAAFQEVLKECGIPT